MHHYTAVTDADLPDVFRVMRLAFTGEEPGQRQWLTTMGIENMRAMRPAKDARPDAVVSFVRMGQHFGGRVVPMTGIVGVAVAPERRGGGLAQSMMTHALRETRHEGVPISALYASTQALYRKVGYEQAGSRFLITLRPDQIDIRGRTGALRPITDADAEPVMACAHSFASLFDGTLDRGLTAGWNAYCWRRVREMRDTNYDGFAVANPTDSTRIDGYLYMSQSRKPDGRQSISISDLAFTTADAGRRLLAFMADYAMMADEVSFFGSPAHPILSLLPQQRYRVEKRDYWMLRMTDLPRAFECRGWTPGVRAAINLEVADPIIPENAGAWTLEIDSGRAQATKGRHTGGPTIRGDIRALGALYSGFVTPGQARLLGWIEADEESIRAAASIFPGSSPWMIDMF